MQKSGFEVFFNDGIDSAHSNLKKDYVLDEAGNISVIFITTKDIEAGEEIIFPYNESNPDPKHYL